MENNNNLDPISCVFIHENGVFRTEGNRTLANVAADESRMDFEKFMTVRGLSPKDSDYRKIANIIAKIDFRIHVDYIDHMEWKIESTQPDRDCMLALGATLMDMVIARANRWKYMGQQKTNEKFNKIVENEIFNEIVDGIEDMDENPDTNEDNPND